jgi:hypothetical protein
MTKRSHDPLALHARWLRRMSEYLHTVGERAGAWQLDPAVWTKLYVTLWGDMARDTADWALGADVDPFRSGVRSGASRCTIGTGRPQCRSTFPSRHSAVGVNR